MIQLTVVKKDNSFQLKINFPGVFFPFNPPPSGQPIHYFPTAIGKQIYISEYK